MILSIVIPVFNEGDSIARSLPAILEECDQLADIDMQLILVDDGSSDNTLSVAREICDNHDEVELLALTRHFGKEAAILAGLKEARGSAAIVMDSDLQHPPHLIPKMIHLWRGGSEVVEACKRSRGNENAFAKMSAFGFYRLFHIFTGMDITNQSDYKLLDRKVVDTYCRLPERNRFFRGLVAWMGFTSTQIFFDVQTRGRGTSSWSTFRLLRFSQRAMAAFTSAPLHMVTIFGVVFLVIGTIVAMIALYQKIAGVAIGGFTTVVLLLVFVGGLIMLALGQIGIYLEQIYDEVKRRPAFLVSTKKSVIKGEKE